MHVRGIVASSVDYSVVRGKSGECVDMGIGIVSFEVSVVDPQDSISAEIRFKRILDLPARHGGVAVGRQQAFRGGEQCAATVRIYTSAFENESEPVGNASRAHQRGIR